MGKQLTTSLTPIKSEIKEFSSPFSLLPASTLPPEIVIEPVNNFTQTTWISKYINDIPVYQTLNPQENRISVVKGTAFNMEVVAIDPTNTDTLNNASRLSYKWKKNDALVYRFSEEGGKAKFSIDTSESVSSLTGVYNCEVSNPYGTTITENITLEVIDPDNHEKLYKNLILNGDASGTDGWELDGEIKIEAFQQDIVQAKNFGSFRLGGLVTFASGSDSQPNILPSQFRFSNANHSGLFLPWYKKRLASDPTFQDARLKSKAEDVLSLEESFISQGVLPQIVANEDFETGSLAGFFPGPQWIDKHNKNQISDVANLSTNLNKNNLTYFTREKIKFVDSNGTAQASLSQTIDISDISDLVDGNTYGIKHITSQFFAYIGTGITGYQIRAKVKDIGEKTFNYYIGDSEEYKRIFSLNEQDLIKDVYADPDGSFKSYKELAKEFGVDNLNPNEADQTEKFLQQKQLEIQSREQQILVEKDFLERENRQLPLNIDKLKELGANLLDQIIEIGKRIAQLSLRRNKPTDIIEALKKDVDNLKQKIQDSKNTIIENEAKIKANNQRLVELISRELVEIEIQKQQFNNDQELFNKRKWLVNVEQRVYFEAQLRRKYILEKDSDITITPITSDTTEVVISYIDIDGGILKRETIKGPSNKDIWAVKEKVFFPLTLYPLFTYFQPETWDANIRIRVFGQKYTTTNVLLPFFNRVEIGKGVGLLSRGINSLDSNGVFTTSNYNEPKYPLQDKAALFLVNKYDFAKWQSTYPPEKAPYVVERTLRKQTAQAAINDYGAAAMFGASRNTIIPPKTRSIQVSVIFKHNSNIIEDLAPQSKGWLDSELYNDDFGQSSGTSKRLAEYGNPRCGITQIKLQLVANDVEINDKHVTYSMPPPNSTVLGLMKNRYNDPNAYNTADILEFSYKHYKPE